MTDNINKDNIERTKIQTWYQALFVIVYYIAYVAYLCVNQENEFWHWLTMVLIPLFLAYLYNKLTLKTNSLFYLLKTFGINRSVLKNKISIAVLLGLAFCLLQFFLSRNKNELIQLAQSGKMFYLFPLSFLVMSVTAGFTEEFFFRGFLQTRISAAIQIPLLSILITSVLFSIYHLPYAYFNINWPSHGNFPAALETTFMQAMPVGIIAGYLYHKSGNNLAACVILHSFINSLPAMLQIF